MYEADAVGGGGGGGGAFGRFRWWWTGPYRTRACIQRDHEMVQAHSAPPPPPPPIPPVKYVPRSLCMRAIWACPPSTKLSIFLILYTFMHNLHYHVSAVCFAFVGISFFLSQFSDRCGMKRHIAELVCLRQPHLTKLKVTGVVIGGHRSASLLHLVSKFFSFNLCT